MASRRLLHGSLRNGKNGGGLAILLVVLVLAVIGYLITMLMRFAISRNREYMADAGSAEMTKNPLALASALRKISTDPLIEAVEQNDVAQLFIENPMKKGASFVNELFATHPPIEKESGCSNSSDRPRTMHINSNNMEKESPLLNVHNKTEYPPMHTAEHILNRTMVNRFGCPRSRNTHIERKNRNATISSPLPRQTNRSQRSNIA